MLGLVESYVALKTANEHEKTGNGSKCRSTEAMQVTVARGYSHERHRL